MDRLAQGRLEYTSRGDLPPAVDFPASRVGWPVGGLHPWRRDPEFSDHALSEHGHISSPDEPGRKAQQQRSLERAVTIARIADEFRCQDVVLLDLTKITPVVDYFVIATGTSRRQMHAVAIEVERLLKESGSRRIGVEGFETSTWILEDYGDVVLHVFTDEARSVYSLESLWADAVKIEWKALVGAAPAP